MTGRDRAKEIVLARIASIRGRTAWSADGTLAVLLGGLLIAGVFVTQGGSSLGSSTWTEITCLVIGAALFVGVVLYGRRARWGAITVAWFACFSVLTAVSVGWSVKPDASWLVANQTFSYLAVFVAAAALARLFGERWPGLISAIAFATAVVSAYALLEKVFPGTLDAGDPYGRLVGPFNYWNATGVLAAMGLPAALWVGSRRGAGRWSGALSVPAIGILTTVVVLSYSRGAILAAVIACVLWFAAVPLRLRGAAILAAGLAGAAALSTWALTTRALTTDGALLSSRSSAGHTFGVVLLIVLLLQGLAGLVVSTSLARHRLPAQTRRKLGTALVCIVALLPVAGIAVLAASSRGLTGEISHIWNTATSSSSVVNGTSPGRLLTVANSRGQYWDEALKIGRQALFDGVGAGGYATARTRYTTNPHPVAHAHGYLPQTFADLGLLGLAITLALLIAWAVSVARALGIRDQSGQLEPHERAEPAEPAGWPERAGMLTLLAVVAAFGADSSIDWIWFIPGITIPALACAGWLTGRGPLNQGVGRIARRRLSSSPGATGVVVLVVVVTVLGGWLIWQPLRSADAETRAVDAASAGNTALALTQAREAAASNPEAVEPLFTLSAIYETVGDRVGARAELQHAVQLQPANAETWLLLGEFDLRGGRPRAALDELRAAARLDRSSAEAQAMIARARAALARG
jgi:tetratricopeptide (TPR) repeat protein